MYDIKVGDVVINTDRKIKSMYLDIEIVIDIKTHNDLGRTIIDEVVTEYKRVNDIYHDVNIRQHGWIYFKKYYKKININDE